MPNVWMALSQSREDHINQNLQNPSRISLRYFQSNKYNEVNSASVVSLFYSSDSLTTTTVDLVSKKPQ